MISVIVCSAKEPSQAALHRQNAAKTIGPMPWEYLRIDNRESATGICSAYNRGVAAAQGDILVFVHDDAFFMEPGWGGVLAAKFSADRSLGMVGVAGTQYLSRDKMAWTMAGRPYIQGRVVHDLAATNEYFMSAFSTEPGDAEVVALDGLFFAVRRELFETIRFDEETFDGYHFYDLDICMQARRHCKIIVTWDILVKHCSAGNPGDAWREYGRKFLAKYKEELPACCAAAMPDFSKLRQPGLKFDLRGKASREIIC
jgi:GT2 family glycosyltransferase